MLNVNENILQSHVHDISTQTLTTSTCILIIINIHTSVPSL